MTQIKPPAQIKPLDRAFALEAVRVTEAAAIAAYAEIGRGNEHQADHAAVEAMRAAFNRLPIDGTVVIGEGERDEAPMLFIGEKVGQGGLSVDIALDPLEGTTLTAKAMANALAVMAMAEPGTMLNAPDTYMDKIAIGPGHKVGNFFGVAPMDALMKLEICMIDGKIDGFTRCESALPGGD